MKNLIGKGQHIVNVGNHPHIKLVGKAKEQKQYKTIYIHNKSLQDTQNIDIKCVKKCKQEGRKVQMQGCCI